MKPHHFFADSVVDLKHGLLQRLELVGDEHPGGLLDVAKAAGVLRDYTHQLGRDAMPGQLIVTGDIFNAPELILLNLPTKLGKPLGDLATRQFKPALVQRIIDKIAAEGTPSKANHILRYMHRLFRWGINRGYYNTNPAQGVESAKERKQRRLPDRETVAALTQFAKERGQRTRGEKGACAPYLWIVMELAYICRLRGVEIVTLTDANHTTEGVLTNRRKGSRDNIVRWYPRLSNAWNAATDRRAAIWKEKGRILPMHPESRPLIVAADGGELRKSSLDTAWQRLIKMAIEEGVIEEGQRFGLHDLKRRGITDTKGTRYDKQEASGHRSAAMLDVYDLSVPIVRWPEQT